MSVGKHRRPDPTPRNGATMTHELQTPTTNVTEDAAALLTASGHGTALVRYACTCGHWWRVFHESMTPRAEEIESAHETHRQQAGAEDLRNGVNPEPKPDPLDAIVAITRALADAAAAGVRAMESMEEFVAAHKAASERGIGVTVVRQADGSITSTPNVFVQAGTAVFMDSPTITNTLHKDYAPLQIVEDGVPRWEPRYTIAPVPHHDAVITSVDVA